MTLRLLPSPSLPRNPAFEKALALLAHPASLAAMGFLLLNDHVFRRLWPSWWTGKVGDVAWLFFAPFALAAVVAWLVPLRARACTSWVFRLSFSGVGVCFVLFKTVPGIAQMAIRITGALFHSPLVVTRDPSDLLALPALFAAVLLWKRSGQGTQPLETPLCDHRHPAVKPENAVSLRGWVVLPIAALLTLANAGIPDAGIICLDAQNGVLGAGNGFTTYTSSNGGLTWEPGTMGFHEGCDRSISGEWRETPGLAPGMVYRYRAGGAILVSSDQGQTWETAFDLTTISEPRQFYYVKSGSGNPVYAPGPLDALADPISGNTLFAMGHQGVLVRTGAGEWIWSPVGNYHPLEPFPTADAFSLLLGGMLLLAAGLFLLVFSTQALRWAGGTLRTIVTGLGWIAWLIVDVLFPPAQASGYGTMMSGAGVAAILVLAVPLAIEQTIRLARRAPRGLLPLAGFGLLTALMYFLPYVLWLYSTLPTLWWATIFGLVTAGVVLVAALIAARGLPVSHARRGKAGGTKE